ncbi:MAG: RHS repeat-associated core domain-containing protein [Verrucomicrobia bacterium]|nr:RHS repeat-associated core domain-containing protein [Verrucomicrobiota bacterium]
MNDSLSQVSAASRGSLNLNATVISGIPAAEETWGYDPTGNWLRYQQAQNGTETLDQSRVHDRGNRLTQIEDNPNVMILDRAGRMRQLSPDASGDWNGKLDLTWDAWSRITQVRNNGILVGTYQYDGLYRRITRVVGGVTLHSYYNDEWRPLEERKNSETTPTMSYLWGARHRDDLARLDRAVSGTALNETRYILMDYFNASAISDGAGDVKERYAYSTFGVRTILNPDYTSRTTSESAMDFGFQGQFLDVESGLVNYGYRYYVPALGRWTCKDPIGEKGGSNLYGMLRNNTINKTDLLGLYPCCDGVDFDAEKECCEDKKIVAKVKIWKCERPVGGWKGSFLPNHKYVCCQGPNSGCYGHQNNDLKKGDPIPPEGDPTGDCTEKEVCPKVKADHCSSPKSPKDAGTCTWNCRDWTDWEDPDDRDLPDTHPDSMETPGGP